MAKFIICAWVLLFGFIASVQVFDFWRLDPADGVEVASFCEGSSCRNDKYKARVFYLYGDTDRVLIRDSADIQLGCGAEKSTHIKAKAVRRGDSVEGVQGQNSFDRQKQSVRVVNDLSVFFPCDAPENASAFGVAVSVPVWVRQGLANVRDTLGVTRATFDVTN